MIPKKQFVARRSIITLIPPWSKVCCWVDCSTPPYPNGRGLPKLCKIQREGIETVMISGSWEITYTAHAPSLVRNLQIADERRSMYMYRVQQAEAIAERLKSANARTRDVLDQSLKFGLRY
jgi:hypothetical protein